MTKTNPGRFFEDYRVGDVIRHAIPRTVAEGERALYHALYPARGAVYSSDDFAARCGLDGSPLDDLLAFHVVFGKTVPDISLNAVANLGYAEGRWLKPVYAGDTIYPALEVIEHAYEAAGHEHPDADSFLELRPAGPHADILEWAYIVRLRYGRDGRSITIYGTGFAAMITGRNLIQLVPRLKARKIDWLQAYDPKRWPERPAEGAPIIERIELIEDGGDMGPPDPRGGS